MKSPITIKLALLLTVACAGIMAVSAFGANGAPISRAGSSIPAGSTAPALAVAPAPAPAAVPDNRPTPAPTHHRSNFIFKLPSVNPCG